MYAAADTAFSRQLAKQGALGESKMGNSSYRLAYPSSEKVYQALRVWQKARGTVYDQAINPISAPKTIVSAGYAEYHQICLELFHQDVNFFGLVLESAEHCISLEQILDLTRNEIAAQLGFNQRITSQIIALDSKHGLNDKVCPNPFLH